MSADAAECVVGGGFAVGGDLAADGDLVDGDGAAHVQPVVVESGEDERVLR